MKEDMTNVTAFQSLKSPVPEGEENLCAGRLAPPALSRPKKKYMETIALHGSGNPQALQRSDASDGRGCLISNVRYNRGNLAYTWLHELLSGMDELPTFI